MKDKYLVIRNDGKLDIMGLLLMGASTKRGNKDLIGEYGSGLKYAIAILLREGLECFVLSGLSQISFSTEEVDLRGKTYERIVIDTGDRQILTNYTTDMGPDWELWMAIREIYCNAIDEGGHTIQELEYNDIYDDLYNCKLWQDNKTFFVIKINEDLEDIINNWEWFFSFDRHAHLVMEVPNVLKVYSPLGEKSTIYRKGIRVAFSDLPGCYDYDFHDIDINELREAKDFYQIRETLKNAMLHYFDSEVIKEILASKDTWEKQINFHSWDSMVNKKSWAGALSISPIVHDCNSKTAVSKRYQTVVPEEYAGEMKPKKKDKDNLIMIPMDWCKLIAPNLPEVMVMGYENGEIAIRIRPEDIPAGFQQLIIDAVHILESMGLKEIIDRPLMVCDFKNSRILSTNSKGTINLSARIQYNISAAGPIARLILKEAICITYGCKFGSEQYCNALMELVFKHPLKQVELLNIDNNDDALPF